MKIKLLLLAVVVLCACGTQKVSEDESYDRITTWTYKNKYDENNKLLEVQLTTVSYHIFDKASGDVALTTDTCTESYKYINDDEFVVERRTEASGDIDIEKYSPTMDEFLTLTAQKDTACYWLRKYCDNSKRELAYERRIENVFLLDEWNDYEEKNEYDEHGNLIKRVKHYFDTNKKKITYWFQGLSYEEAKKRIPSINEDCNVVCHIDRMVGDTLIRQTLINGIIDSIEKTVTEENGKKEFRFNANMKLMDSFVELKGKDFDIHVRHVYYPKGGADYLDEWTDSTYYDKKGKEVRRANISNKDKSIVVSKYDRQGNIIQEVEKVKYFDTYNGTEVINEMLQLLRENEKKKESRNIHK